MSFLYEFGIDEDTTAVFADDDLLAQLQIYLALGWNLVEATTTSVTVDGYDSKTIAGSFADTSEGVEETFLDTFLQADSFSTERFFFLLCFPLDTCQLLLLSLQIYTALTDSFLEGSDTLLAVLDLGRPFSDALLGELDLEALEFDFLGEVVVLAVVLDVVELLLIFLDALFSLLDLSLLATACTWRLLSSSRCLRRVSIPSISSSRSCTSRGSSPRRVLIWSILVKVSCRRLRAMSLSATVRSAELTLASGLATVVATSGVATSLALVDFLVVVFFVVVSFAIMDAVTLL